MSTQGREYMPPKSRKILQPNPSPSWRQCLDEFRPPRYTFERSNTPLTTDDPVRQWVRSITNDDGHTLPVFLQNDRCADWPARKYVIKPNIDGCPAVALHVFVPPPSFNTRKPTSDTSSYNAAGYNASGYNASGYNAARSATVALPDRKMVKAIANTVALLHSHRGRTNEPSREPSTIIMVWIKHARARRLPSEPMAYIMPEHVNGGATFMRDPRPIIVYRTEDACKVMIHELLHYFGQDHHLATKISGGLETIYNTRFGVDGPNRLMSEAYTDALACYLHAVFCNRSVNAERRHIYRVAVRLLLYFGRSRGQLDHPTPPFREKTNAFGYYVCKAAIWMHLDEFLKLFSPESPPGANDDRETHDFVNLMMRWTTEWMERVDASAFSSTTRSTSLRMTSIRSKDT